MQGIQNAGVWYRWRASMRSPGRGVRDADATFFLHQLALAHALEPRASVAFASQLGYSVQETAAVRTRASPNVVLLLDPATTAG